MINYYDLFSDLNINKNDKVLFHTDFLQLTFLLKKNKQQIDFEKIINVFQDMVSNNGLLLFPTFNWGFCQKQPFDYRERNSQTGAITNFCLASPQFKRTKHPIYSFAVWGKDQDYLCSLDYQDSFGMDSIFHYLYQSKAKVVFINVSYKHSATFIHYVEEKIGVPYRYKKNFTAEYINEKGEKSIRTYSMYVRKLEYNVETLIDPLQEDFIKNNCVQEIQNDCGIVRVLDYRKACDIAENDIINNGAKKLAFWQD